ncbi:MAG: hypothetical protein IRZ08_14560 [Frankia sp.]|nr:hypothetical protein [Frankia sp.]
MTARHLGDLICPLVDGQLQHDERDRALAHLAHCPTCRHLVADYRRMKQRLAALATPTLPDTLADRILGLGISLGVGQAPAGQPGRPGLLGQPGQGSGGAGRVGPGWARPCATPALWRDEPRSHRRTALGTGPRRPSRVRAGSRPLAVGDPVLASRPSLAVRVAAATVTVAAPAVAPTAAAMVAASAAQRARSTARVRGQARLRRALLGSAAVMLLTLAGSMLLDSSGSARTPRPGADPTVGPPASVRTVQFANEPARRMTPLIAPVVFPSYR